MKLYALAFDATYDGVPVDQYTLGVFTSIEEAKSFASEIFRNIDWEWDEDDKDAWHISSSLELSTLYDHDYDPEVMIVVDMLWIRPYETNRLIATCPVFYIDTELSEVHGC